MRLLINTARVPGGQKLRVILLPIRKPTPAPGLGFISTQSSAFHNLFSFSDKSPTADKPHWRAGHCEWKVNCAGGGVGWGGSRPYPLCSHSGLPWGSLTARKKEARARTAGGCCFASQVAPQHRKPAWFHFLSTPGSGLLEEAQGKADYPEEGKAHPHHPSQNAPC